MNERKKEWIKDEWLIERMNKGWMSEKKEWIKDEWLEERINKGWMSGRKNK